MSFRQFVENIIRRVMLFPIRFSMQRGWKNFAYRYVYEVLKIFDTEGDEYVSLYKRPKTHSQIVLIEKANEINESSVIIMQGPLCKEENFTLETVRLYGKLYPGTLIIVSTWRGEDSVTIDRLLREKNCEVVLNEYPEHTGVLNLNYQVVSTLGGIRKAKELGKQYIFKTRCDYRFYRFALLQYFYHLIKLFPIDSSIGYQKYRLIFGSTLMNSMFRPFWLTDQFVYGNVNDMYSYWNYSMTQNDISKNEVSKIIRSRHMSWNERTEEHLASEPELIRDYIRRQEGEYPEISVKEYWDRLVRQFIVLSREEVGFFWRKYDRRFNETKWNGNFYRENDSSKCLNYNWSFPQWFSLYSGSLKYSEEYENFATLNRS